MKNILVSINCITYNHEKYIADAIESFLMQKTNFKYEILIHDDASTDNTVNIIKSYENKYPDMIKPIYQTENQYSKGIKVDQLNLERVKGKYIAICEGDDYWTDPYKLQKQVNFMEDNLECGMCFHATKIIDAPTNKEIGIIKPYNKNCNSTTDDMILGGGAFIATNSILYRKELTDKIPDFFMSTDVGDYPLQVYLSTQKYAYYINDFMSAYRKNVEGSWTNRSLKGKGKDFLEKKIKNYCKDITMLEEFNKEFSRKYDASVRKAVLERKCYTYLCKHDLKSLKVSDAYSFYRSLSINKRIKMILLSYFPYFYQRIASLKQLINLKLL